MNIMALAKLVPKLSNVKTKFVKADEKELTLTIAFADKESFDDIIKVIDEFRGDE